MAIKFIDILEPVNPAASAIAKSKQIAGARSVATRSDLDTIIPQVLSASYNPADGSYENDAVGQVWYVADENKYYKLTGFSVDTSTSPFTINRTWNLFIDTSITASAIDNRIDSKLRSGFETQTIFGYDTLTGQQINSNSIYVGGYGNYDGIMIQSNGKFFDFPTDNGGTLSTQNYVNNYVNDTKLNINDNINSKIEILENEIDSSVVKFENIPELSPDDIKTISNENIAIEQNTQIANGNITPLSTLLSDYQNYNRQLTSIKHFTYLPNVTDVDSGKVEFVSTELGDRAGTLPVGFESYADKNVSPVTTATGSGKVYKYVEFNAGNDPDGNPIKEIGLTNASNWSTAILEGDVTHIGRNSEYTFPYIDTSKQSVTFNYTVYNNAQTQNVFYVTTAGVENDIRYSIAIGNSYDSNPYVNIGYTNSEIGIHSNPKDYATFQKQAAGTGDWTILTQFNENLEPSVPTAGRLHYTITINNGKLQCSVAAGDAVYNFPEIDIPNFKFKYFGFMTDGITGNAKILNVSANIENLPLKYVPLYLKAYYTTEADNTPVYVGCSNNYLTVDDNASELIWNFDNLVIPTNATTLYTYFTLNNRTYSIDELYQYSVPVNLLTYTTNSDDFGYITLRTSDFVSNYSETLATEYEFVLYDINDISCSQQLYTGPNNRNILLSAEDYVKFDRPIASSLIKSVDGNRIGGNISVPFIDGNDTFALVSDIDSVNLQTVLDNQGAEQVVLNTILTISKTPVEDVHPILMFGDFSSRIGSVYYPQAGQPGRITGFINETVRNPDGSFTTTNIVAGSPLTITDGTADEHAATVGQVGQMISSAMSEMDDRNVKKYNVSNPEISVVNGIATWQNVVKLKNNDGVTGIDFENAPVVHVYNKTNGMTVYPDIELKSISENNENYTAVNIIFKSNSDLVNNNEYIAIIMTSAKTV